MRVITAAAVAAFAHAAVPTVPSYNPSLQYYAAGVIAMPYPQINLTMPFSTYYDGANGRQRLSYYDDMDVTIYRADTNVTWALSPEINVMACFTTNGSTSLTTMFPDTTGYVYMGTSLLDGKLVNTYQLTTSQGEKTAQYNFSVLASDNYTPVQLAFLGRDLVIGSHTDIYIFTYDSVVFGATGNWPADIFDQPQGYECGGYPGPGAEMQAQGNGLVRELIPQPGASSAPVEPSNDPAFTSFMATYGKRYATDDEMRIRHSRFTRARRVIEATNRKNKVAHKSLRLAMNHLGDATEAEMNLRRGKRADGTSFNAASAVPQLPPVPALYTVQPPTGAELADLPTSVDWRTAGAVEPVMDQGICGSCWTFGATGAVSGQYFLKYGSMVIFSKQEVVDCSWNFGVDGCGGGEDFLAYSWMMYNGGLASKDQYGPYLSQNGYCKANSAGRTAVLKGYVNVTSGSETALMTALANMGPVSISVDAAVDTFSFYSSGVLDDPACSANPAAQDHTILAVGYGTDPATGLDYWIARNSWSTYWGDGGFIKIARPGNICGVTDAPTVPQLV